LGILLKNLIDLLLGGIFPTDPPIGAKEFGSS
jgi:hypothetical protein